MSSVFGTNLKTLRLGSGPGENRTLVTGGSACGIAPGRTHWQAQKTWGVQVAHLPDATPFLGTCGCAATTPTYAARPTRTPGKRLSDAVPSMHPIRRIITAYPIGLCQLYQIDRTGQLAIIGLCAGYTLRERYIWVVSANAGIACFSEGESMEFESVLQIIESLGVVGFLLFMVFAFYRGDIIPKTVLNRILALYEERMEDMTRRILERLDELLADRRL